MSNKVTLTGKDTSKGNKPNNGILFLPNIWDGDNDDGDEDEIEDEYEDDEYDY